MIDPDFMMRAKELAKPLIKEIHSHKNEQHKKWKQKNPEKFRASLNASSAKRREKYKMARAVLSIQEKKDIRKFYEDCPKGYVIDHIIPLAKGGSHTLGNLQYLTQEENSQKHAKWMGVEDGETYDPDFLLKRLQKELDENEKEEIFVVTEIKHT
jgi:5-methylcytosine-specific restriction endonuclease McrA